MAESTSEITARLRRSAVFKDLPSEQLEWFTAHTTERALDPGEVLFQKGETPDSMIVMLEGETHALRNEAAPDGFVYIAKARDPATEITGKLPFSRMKTFEATARATTPTRLLLFPVPLYPELMQRMPELVERLVWNMSDRVRETTKIDEQRDKLISLGKLSAGLAHELNNPAAAARRAADELGIALENLRNSDLRLCRHHLTSEQRSIPDQLERESFVNVGKTFKDALAQSDKEDEMAAWLVGKGVAEAWTLAPTLVEAGLETINLEKLAPQIECEVLTDALARIAAQIVAARLASDISTSVGRISELVSAIKEYSYMDRAPIAEVDLHQGLDNTLLILKYKLKKKSIEVQKDYAADLPRISAFGSELNQMWTNLIDNAIDAMPESNGILKIRTKLESTIVLIEIRDNGAGIPAEAQPHVFEPFYTTKSVGEGTGLGLNTVARIVRHHRGNIRFETKPGDTCFQVRLPIK